MGKQKINNFIFFALSLTLLIVFIPVNTKALGRGSGPEEIKILELSQKLDNVFQNFIQKSQPYRLGYYYAGDFVSSEHKEQTRSLALETSQKLKDILQQHKRMLEAIEDYEGQDWDLKYGKTGLWQGLKTDIEKTLVARLEVDCWAITANGKAREDQMQDILARWQVLELGNVSFKKYLLGRIISVEDKSKALEVFSSIDPNSLQRDLRNQLILEKSRIALESGKPVEADKVIEIINSASGIENKLYGCFLLERDGYDKVLRQTVTNLPETRSLVSQILFEHLDSNYEKVLKRYKDFHLLLVAEHMYRLGCDNIDKLILEKIISTKKFQKPYFDFIIASCTKDAKPARAVDLFIGAADAKDTYGFYQKKQAAYQAAVLGYKLFQSDKMFSSLAIKAFEALKRHDREVFDREMVFIYSKLLKYSKDPNLYIREMKRIAAGKNDYSIYARYELLLGEIENLKTQEDKLSEHLKNSLKKLIRDAAESGKPQIADNAAVLWGQFAVNDPNKTELKNYYQLTSQLDTSPQSLFYKAAAAAYLNYIIEAVTICKKAVVQNDDIENYLYEIYQVISKAAETIDYPRIKESENYKKHLENIDEIGQVCSYQTPGVVRNAIVACWIESIAYAGKFDVEKDKIWSSIASTEQNQTLAFIRAKARVDFAMANFEKSAQSWAEIAKYYKKNLESGSHLTKWWKAKYYQLMALSKTSGEKESLKHHIEVLLKTNKQTDNFWAEKINQIQSQI